MGDLQSNGARPAEDGPPQRTQEVSASAKSIVEALLFASDRPLTLQKLGEISGLDGRAVRASIDELNREYEEQTRSYRIEEIGGGFQILTLPAFSKWVGSLTRSQVESRLSKAALETLAIIAYKQPVLRAEVDAIRGVQSGQIIRTLMDKGLVRITGRKEVPGRPMLHGTTRKFLEAFGLRAVGDLPKMDDFAQP